MVIIEMEDLEVDFKEIMNEDSSDKEMLSDNTADDSDLSWYEIV